MTQAETNLEQIHNIRKRLLHGDISYAEARAEATPVINNIYEQHKAIAKKYNKRAIKLSFESLMR